MLRKSSNLMRAALAVALVATALPAGAQVTPAPGPARLAPPTLIAPINEQTRAVPALFQWNVGGAAGNVYGISISNVRRGTLVVAQQTASYQLQIASASPDAPDISFNRVLIDATSSTTTFLFDNRNVAGSFFTSAVPPGLPLPAGRYYWRVRLEQPGAPFSTPGVFRLLSGAAVQTPTHQLSITNLALGANPKAQSATLVIATIANTGTFSEPPNDLRIVANGTLIAEGRTPPLAPNQHVDLVSAWIPATPGIAQLTATIEANGDQPNSGRFVRNVPIGQTRAVTTSLVGTIRRGQFGDYTLEDNGGRVLALVIAGRGLDLSSFVGRRVTVSGKLTEGALGLQLNATNIAPAS
jgi:CARDB